MEKGKGRLTIGSGAGGIRAGGVNHGDSAALHTRGQALVCTGTTSHIREVEISTLSGFEPWSLLLTL